MLRRILFDEPIISRAAYDLPSRNAALSSTSSDNEGDDRFFVAILIRPAIVESAA
jgi:hypothetical protein